jgi:hypothetical protein
VTNGVKQGDALSCTLFILGIEPLIRNIQNNNQIVPIKSRTLQYEWPKVFGYADDITCVVLNNDTSKQQIFTEYERFTKFAGLKLNADKTEIYCFDGNNRVQHGLTNITYLGENVTIIPKESIKVNGIELCQNLRTLRRLNAEKLLAKMDRHFKQWAKRHLSLLGKVQIYKTFGLSQFLYHLSVFEPDTQIWKEISVRINKFMWNRNYQGNQAPHRIKKEVFHNDISKGGFGMIDIKEVVAALRLKRHLTLTVNDVHPMHKLINILNDEDSYFINKSILNIDEVTDTNLAVLSAKRIKDYEAPNWILESDLLLHKYLLHAKLTTLVRQRKRGGREERSLLNLGIYTLAEAIRGPISNVNKLLTIAHKTLHNAIKIVNTLYRRAVVPDKIPGNKLKNGLGIWKDASQYNSKKLRGLLRAKSNMSNPKIIELEDEVMTQYYQKIGKISNVANKNRMLRLLQGDVYCGDRLVRFGMTESDRCRRCFEKETIIHLTLECPYTKLVLQKLGM